MDAQERDEASSELQGQWLVALDKAHGDDPCDDAWVIGWDAIVKMQACLLHQLGPELSPKKMRRLLAAQARAVIGVTQDLHRPIKRAARAKN